MHAWAGFQSSIWFTFGLFIMIHFFIAYVHFSNTKRQHKLLGCVGFRKNQPRLRVWWSAVVLRCFLHSAKFLPVFFRCEFPLLTFRNTHLTFWWIVWLRIPHSQGQPHKSTVCRFKGMLTNNPSALLKSERSSIAPRVKRRLVNACCWISHCVVSTQLQRFFCKFWELSGLAGCSQEVDANSNWISLNVQADSVRLFLELLLFFQWLSVNLSFNASHQYEVIYLVMIFRYISHNVFVSCICSTKCFRYGIRYSSCSVFF